MKKWFLMLAAALLMAAPATAQQASLAGKWSAETQGQQGPMKLDLEIKPVVAGKLEGAMAMGPMGNLPLKDGTVAGTKVSFVTEFDYQGTALSIKYSGELKGDVLALTREIPGMGAPTAVEFKRVK